MSGAFGSTVPQAGILQRPGYVRNSSSTSDPGSFRGPRRLVDRRVAELSQTMRLDLPPQFIPLQPISARSSAGSSPSVHFSAPPTPTGTRDVDKLIIQMPQSAPAVAGYFAGHEPRAPATLFGKQTKFRPLWLLAMGNSGSAFFVAGEVVLQRAIWPQSAYAGVNPDGLTIIPSGTSGFGGAFGGRVQGIVGGSVMMAAGVSTAVLASYLFLRDGHALAHRANPAKPDYRRANAYFAAHQFGILLMVTHRFATELFRERLPATSAWIATIPGALGQATFAITQAQSFSSSEVFNGKMPIPHRAAWSAVARAGVANYVFVGGIIGTPNISAYIRESVRIVAQTSMAIAFSLPLTTARLAQNLPPRRASADPRVESWRSITIFSRYAVARLVGSFGAGYFARGTWPALRAIAGAPSSEASPTTGWRGLPPPMPSGPHNSELQEAGIVLITAGMVFAIIAFHDMRRGSLYRGKTVANSLFSGAILGTMLSAGGRILTEKAKTHADFSLLWNGVAAGFAANALSFVVVPELFAACEVFYGNAPIPYRYHVTEATRALGSLSWTFWAAMSGILGFPSNARQVMAWSATTFCILGMGLPDADTRRSQTGWTTPDPEAVPQWVPPGTPRH